MVDTEASGAIGGTVDPTVITSLGSDGSGCAVYVFDGADAQLDDIYFPMNNPVPDTQNGFRLYRCDLISSLEADMERFAGDSEILLELASRGVQIGSVSTRVIYGDERSRISPIKDTVRFFRMLRHQGR